MLNNHKNSTALNEILVETKQLSNMKTTAWLIKQRYNIITFEMMIGCELFSGN